MSADEDSQSFGLLPRASRALSPSVVADGRRSVTEVPVHIDLADFLPARQPRQQLQHEGGSAHEGDSAGGVAGQLNGSSVVFNEEQLQALVENLQHLVSALTPKAEEAAAPVKKKKISEKLTNRSLLITAGLQLFNLGILWIIDASTHSTGPTVASRTPEFIAAVVVMVLIQLAQLVFVVVMSIKLTKQLLHQTASDGFLVQSYLSTVLLFAGMYTLLYRVDSNNWIGISVSSSGVANAWILSVFIKFVYFSIATMTTTGYGDIVPSDVFYLYLIVSMQMLMGVVYTTSIFARGFALFSKARPKKKEPFWKRFKPKRRNNAELPL